VTLYQEHLKRNGEFQSYRPSAHTWLGFGSQKIEALKQKLLVRFNWNQYTPKV